MVVGKWCWNWYDVMTPLIDDSDGAGLMMEEWYRQLGSKVILLRLKLRDNDDSVTKLFSAGKPEEAWWCWLLAWWLWCVSVWWLTGAWWHSRRNRRLGGGDAAPVLMVAGEAAVWPGDGNIVVEWWAQPAMIDIGQAEQAWRNAWNVTTDDCFWKWRLPKADAALLKADDDNYDAGDAAVTKPADW